MINGSRLFGSSLIFGDGKPPLSHVLRAVLARDEPVGVPAAAAPLAPAAAAGSSPNPSPARVPAVSEPRAMTPDGHPTARPVPASFFQPAASLRTAGDSATGDDVVLPPSQFEAPPLPHHQAPPMPVPGSISSEFVFNRAGGSCLDDEQQSQRYDHVDIGDSPVDATIGDTVDAVSCIRNVGTGMQDDDGVDNDATAVDDDAFQSMLPAVEELQRKIGTEARKAKVIRDLHDETKRVAAAAHLQAKLRFDEDHQQQHGRGLGHD
jgi:hypothetical protein